MKVGISYGMVNSKKPLNTGRADYYGVLANGAARVMALAAPGQVRRQGPVGCLRAAGPLSFDVWVSLLLLRHRQHNHVLIVMRAGPC